MNFGYGERLPENIVARIYEETVDINYKKASINANTSDTAISTETIMEKLHNLKFSLVKIPEAKWEINMHKKRLQPKKHMDL